MGDSASRARDLIHDEEMAKKRNEREPMSVLLRRVDEKQLDGVDSEIKEVLSKKLNHEEAMLAATVTPAKHIADTFIVSPVLPAAKEAKPAKKFPFVASELHKAADLYCDRNVIYGDNYHRLGPIMALLMADQKLDCTNGHEMSRYGMLTQIVSKLTRYCQQFNAGGHTDSLDDMTVYTMILKELDNV